MSLFMHSLIMHKCRTGQVTSLHHFDVIPPDTMDAVSLNAVAPSPAALQPQIHNNTAHNSKMANLTECSILSFYETYMNSNTF